VLIPGTDFNKNRDKLFFFAGFEWYRQGVDLGVKKTVVPTAAMRTGDFSDPGLGSLGGITGVQPCPADTWQTLAFCTGAGMLNTSLVDPGGQVLLNLYHLPNATPSPQNGGYITSPTSSTSSRAPQQLVKLDYSATANDQPLGSLQS